ncbi:MAG: UbiD family decarboxylase [Planctomycetaceae bacterium]
MGYRNLQECLADLERTGQLLRIRDEINPHLEAAAIQRRVYEAGGPALLFERVKGTPFPMVSNLFGTMERTRFLFRDRLALVQRLVDLKVDPMRALKHPFQTLRALPTAWSMRPKYVSRGPILECETTLDQLPALTSWPEDGGPFITLPAVYSEHPDQPGWQKSNLGMYRIQISGNDYVRNGEVGLHYQIHRGIGVHHTAALRRGESLRVNIYVGGPPVLPLAAVMPLPEGLSELTFAGALGGRRMRLIPQPDGLPLLAEADFCIVGTIDPTQLKPEGPFGDHLGYYSLRHLFPVLKVERVYHRRDAVWPFTVVGRPPQEDTSFGAIIHEITGAAIPSVLPGVKQVHAVDEAGVHPLLLAIGSERYTPYTSPPRPQELLTQAHAILGQGQLSLAKYLFIINGQDAPQLELHHVSDFFQHLLERVDWSRDLHFETQTTIDTLDYSGDGLNAGSKLVVAATGPSVRTLLDQLPASMSLPDGFHDARVCLPGVVAITAPPCSDPPTAAGRFLEPATSSQLRQRRPPQTTGRVDDLLPQFIAAIEAGHPLLEFPLVVLVDDAPFTAESLANFLWVTFTRSNPASDIDGFGSFTCDKHFGCTGPLVIDARIKPHHAPPLVESPETIARMQTLFAPGTLLHGAVGEQRMPSVTP